MSEKKDAILVKTEEGFRWDPSSVFFMRTDRGPLYFCFYEFFFVKDKLFKKDAFKKIRTILFYKRISNES